MQVSHTYLDKDLSAQILVCLSFVCVFMCMCAMLFMFSFVAIVNNIGGLWSDRDSPRCQHVKAMYVFVRVI